MASSIKRRLLVRALTAPPVPAWSHRLATMSAGSSHSLLYKMLSRRLSMLRGGGTGGGEAAVRGMLWQRQGLLGLPDVLLNVGNQRICTIRSDAKKGSFWQRPTANVSAHL